MIPVHMEPKGLAKDAKPILAKQETTRAQNDATDGSWKLFAALMSAQGIVVPERKKTDPKAEAAHIPERCPHCGAPSLPKMLVAHIQATVASYYNIPLASMTSAQRSYAYAHPRQIAMFLAAELTPKSLPDIGRRFGGRDHTTVIYAIRQVRSRIANDPEIELDVTVLRERLAEALAA